MSSKRRVKGWWVICLMAGLVAQPLLAAESGDISRAVEVAPPKGWTPDMPLFQDEAAPTARDATPAAVREVGVHGSTPAKPARRLEASAVGEAASVRRTRGQGSKERTVSTRREPEPTALSSRETDRRVKASAGVSMKEARVAKAKAPKSAATSTRKASVKPTVKDRSLASAQAARTGKAGKPVATAHTAAAKHGAERHAGQVGDRAASSKLLSKRQASAAQQPVAGFARSAKTKRTETSALAVQQPAARRKQATRVASEQVHAGKPVKTKQAATSQGRSATSKSRQAARETALAQRTAKRAPSATEAGGRATSSGVKKG